MLKLLLEGHSLDDLRLQVAAAHASLGASRPSFFGGGISAVQSTWEQAKQLGYSQGYNAGFGDACDRAAVEESDFAEPERTPAATVALAESHERRAQELRKAVAWRLEQESAQRQRPEGMKDYPPADVAEQAVNQVGPYVNKPADSMDPFAAGQARQEYYAEREGEQRLGASVSSPEMVARALAKQGRTLPGE